MLVFFFLWECTIIGIFKSSVTYSPNIHEFDSNLIFRSNFQFQEIEGKKIKESDTDIGEEATVPNPVERCGRGEGRIGLSFENLTVNAAKGYVWLQLDLVLNKPSYQIYIGTVA